MTAISTTQKIRTLCEEGLELRSARTAAQFFETIRIIASAHDCGPFHAVTVIAEQGYLDAEMDMINGSDRDEKHKKVFRELTCLIKSRLDFYFLENVLRKIASKTADRQSRDIVNSLIDEKDFQNACVILQGLELSEDETEQIVEIRSVI